MFVSKKSDISIAECWERAEDVNAVGGLIANHNGDESAGYWYFGNLGDNVDECERQCDDKPGCEAYT